MNDTYTEVLSALSYSELLHLHGQLTSFFPEHELTPWVEQELEIREEEMRWLIEQANAYAQEMQEELY